MYMLRTGTPIKVYAPFNDPNRVQGSSTEGNTCYTDTVPWKDHVAKRDTLLDKHEVFDAVALHNMRSDTFDWPQWVRDNIRMGYTVFALPNDKGNTVWGMVRNGTAGFDYVD